MTLPTPSPGMIIIAGFELISKLSANHIFESSVITVALFITRVNVAFVPCYLRLKRFPEHCQGCPAELALLWSYFSMDLAVTAVYS